jgi:hypothetical protein
VDRQQITACLHRYTRGCDRIDADLIRSAFHPDAIDYHGPVTGSVDDFLAYWRPLQDAREVSQHYISNTEIDLDGEVAHAETYFVFCQKLKDDPTMTFRGGRYADKLERRDGDWRIAVRVVISEWAMSADGRPATERLAQIKQRGRRDRTDPVFIRPLIGPPDEL